MRLKLFIFTILCILFAGCTVPVLPNGKYETSQPGRDDFIAIYNDMLIMRLRNPEKFTGMDDGYWDWGGKFEIRSDNRIIPDMSRSEKRQWFFYYEFYKNGNGIKVNDLRAENSFQLDYVPARTVPPMSGISSSEGGAKPEEIPAPSYTELK
jgi:hypothetical protein